MRLRRPSPALVISIIALVMATTGSAVAAIDYARNAGAVDGKSAVSYKATLSQAAGRLVATQTSGADKGRLPGKFVAGVVRGTGELGTFGKAVEVVDNQTGAAVPIVGLEGLGTLTASCADQNRTAGIEDPATVLSFTNSSGQVVNFSRSVGNDDAAIQPLPNAVVAQWTVGGSDTFRMQIHLGGRDVIVEGVVRQDAPRTPGASCLVYGMTVSAGA